MKTIDIRGTVGLWKYKECTVNVGVPALAGRCQVCGSAMRFAHTLIAASVRRRRDKKQVSWSDMLPFRIAAPAPAASHTPPPGAPIRSKTKRSCRRLLTTNRA
jgi:hypothetical protein